MKLLEVLADQAFCRVADAQRTDGNRVRLLRDGTETYSAWLEAIESAANSVDLENYIIEEDNVGSSFADALIKAADRGVRCRVVYDWLGCLPRTSRRFWDRLIKSGIEVRRYNPPHFKNPIGWISRDHRKVLCVDDRIAFTGGLCIGHDWVGDDNNGIAPWRDTAIEICGPAVAQIAAAFDDTWDAISKRHHHDEAPRKVEPNVGDVSMLVIAGRPTKMGLYRLEQLIAETAEHSLWLTDGYFVATTGYVRALAGAARAGVDVRLLVPGSSNWPIVGALSKLAYGPLLDAGVRVFEWNGPMVHAKTAVADGCLTRIGSSNSNLASWISNRELDVTISDQDLAAQMETMFRHDLENSTEITLKHHRISLPLPISNGDQSSNRPPRASLGRFLSSSIGLFSTLAASLAQHRQFASAESAVLLGGSGILLFLAVVAVLLPRFVAIPLAILAVWIALGLLLHAIKLWRTGQSFDGE